MNCMEIHGDISYFKRNRRIKILRSKEDYALLDTNISGDRVEHTTLLRNRLSSRKIEEDRCNFHPRRPGWFNVKRRYLIQNVFARVRNVTAACVLAHTRACTHTELSDMHLGMCTDFVYLSFGRNGRRSAYVDGDLPPREQCAG